MGTMLTEGHVSKKVWVGPHKRNGSLVAGYHRGGMPGMPQRGDTPKRPKSLPKRGGKMRAGDTPKNPIRVKDASEALALIEQGKHVQMDPDILSVMLDQLAAIGKEAFEKGKDAPNYDLCKVHVPNTNVFCEANKGITRIKMPQLAGKNIRAGSKAEAKLKRVNAERAAKGKDPDDEVNASDEFVAELRSLGIKVTDTTRPASKLKATQSQIVGAKVGGMMAASKQNGGPLDLTKPIFISSDNYVLDGHHRWAALTGLEFTKGEEMTMNVRVIDMPIVDLVKLTNGFTRSFGIEPNAATNVNKGWGLLADALDRPPCIGCGDEIEKRNYNIPSPLSTPKEIVGSHNHRPAGTSIRWPAMYRELRKKGYTKRKAAMISNGKWRRKHGLGPASVPGTKGLVGKALGLPPRPSIIAKRSWVPPHKRKGKPVAGYWRKTGFTGNQFTRETAITLLSESVRSGGATITPKRKRVTTGYSVSEHEDRSVHMPLMDVSLGDINRWLVENKDLFDSGKQVGAWVDGRELWLDPVTIYTDRDDAIAAGKAHNQKAIAWLDAIERGDWDAAFIDTGGTGEAVAPPPPGESIVMKNHPNRPPDVVLTPDAEAIMAWVKAQQVRAKGTIQKDDGLPERPESVRKAFLARPRNFRAPSLGGGSSGAPGPRKPLTAAQLKQREDAARASALARKKAAYEAALQRGKVKHKQSKSTRKAFKHAIHHAMGEATGIGMAMEADGRWTLPMHPAVKFQLLAKSEPGEFTIDSIEEDKRLVFGWAYMTHDAEGNQVVDKSGDFIDDPWELEDAAYRFVMHSRQGGQDHARGDDGPVVKSTMVESMVFTPEKAQALGVPEGILPMGAWWCGFKVEDDALWAEVKDGKYTSFSIHGSGVRQAAD